MKPASLLDSIRAAADERKSRVDSEGPNVQVPPRPKIKMVEEPATSHPIEQTEDAKQPSKTSKKKEKGTSKKSKPKVEDISFSPHTPEVVAEKQSKDKVLRKYVTSPATKKHFTVVEVDGSSVIFFHNKIFIPSSLRKKTIKWYHQQRPADTEAAIQENCMWPDISSDVQSFLAKKQESESSLPEQAKPKNVTEKEENETNDASVAEKKGLSITPPGSPKKTDKEAKTSIKVAAKKMGKKEEGATGKVKGKRRWFKRNKK